MRDLSRVRTLHGAADILEPRMAAMALSDLRAMRKLADPGSIAEAVRHGNPAAALAVLPLAKVTKALANLGEMSKRTFLLGGKIGAPRVRAR